jgi:hypothetical protein
MKVDSEPDEAGRVFMAGEIIAVASGGGTIESLTGDDLVVATFNDHTAPERIGCIEEYYNPVPAARPLFIDLAKVGACCDAVDAHRVAAEAEADFVFERGIKLTGNELQTTADLRHLLKIQEVRTRDDTDNHDAVIQTQADLEALCKTCEDCCEQLLITRDDAITFGPTT